MSKLFPAKLRRALGRALLFVLAVVVTLAVTFGIGSTRSMQVCMSDTPPSMRTFESRRPPLAEDPSKPLVVVLLGNTQSDVTDVLAPYAMFAEAGTYEVRAVASSRVPRTLTGGLEVVPQLTFAELARARPSGPDIVVVPAILAIESEENAVVRTWLRHEHARRRLIFSWCTGAEVLAASGVLDGRSATTHWADIGRIESSYPAVTWRRGVRYVDEGTVLSAGGLTLGIDTTLRLLQRRDGDAVARHVATWLHHPAPRAFETERVEQHEFELADGIYLLNTGFYWPKRRSGVWLYDGVSEVDLAAILDVYPASFTEIAVTVARQRSVISAHGLELVPRVGLAPRQGFERVIVPGQDAADELNSMSGLVVEHVHRDRSVYPFRATVEDIARREGAATATFAARRLELRSAWTRSATSGFPWRLVWVPVTALAVVFSIAMGLQRFRRAWTSRAAV